MRRRKKNDGAPLDQLTGTVGIKARTGWGKGTDPGQAEILLKDVTQGAGAVTVSGINTVLTADRLSRFVFRGTLRRAPFEAEMDAEIAPAESGKASRMFGCPLRADCVNLLR